MGLFDFISVVFVGLNRWSKVFVLFECYVDVNVLVVFLGEENVCCVGLLV